MKLLCYFFFILLCSLNFINSRNGSNCGISSIYYPTTGTKTPLISYTSLDSNSKYEFTVISRKNRNNFKVDGNIVFSDSENEWYIAKKIDSEEKKKIQQSQMFKLCKQLHLDNSHTNFYSKHPLSLRYEKSNLPNNVSINVISPKTEHNVKKSSFLQVKDIFDENDQSNMLQKSNTENELSKEDSIEKITKNNTFDTSENSIDSVALETEIKKDIGIEKVSYQFDD